MRPARRRRTRPEPAWVRLPESRLLDLRLCDLDLKIEGTVLEERIERLYGELERRGFQFRPHFWLGEEWFSPDGVPGISIPFYLAHPRLMRLERKMMLDVEGGTETSSMKILRHEAGHSFDTAYRLNRRKSWRSVFGKATDPYPKFYQPRPYSRSFVLHLDLWYAQSHPSEDFAETFAVWLKPRLHWSRQYQGWSALNKLLYIDGLMKEISGKPPLVRSREHVENVRTIRKTLRAHYDEKRERYHVAGSQVYDRELLRLFTADPERGRGQPAADFIKRIRPELRAVLSRWTGQYQYVINQLLGKVIERCRKLKLRLDRPERVVKREVLVMLTVQTMNYLHNGHHRIAL